MGGSVGQPAMIGMARHDPEVVAGGGQQRQQSTDAEITKTLSGPPSFWHGLVCPINACAHGLLNESFLSDVFTGREGQTLPFKGRAHAEPTHAKIALL